MPWYEKDDGRFGVPEIDGSHRELARLSDAIVEAYDTSRPSFDVIEDLAARFEEVLLNHFSKEEAILDRQADGDPDWENHRERHKRNHQVFRETMDYVRMKLDDGRTAGEVPNILPLIPDKYFAELKGLDREMIGLLRRSAS